MGNTAAAIRNKLYDYIRIADDKKLKAIYHLLENEIEAANEWWKDKAIVEDMEARYVSLKSGDDKGVTIAELKASVDHLREKKYGE